MNYTAYQITRHCLCVAVAFIPQRIAHAVVDNFVATFLPDLDAPITVPDLNGEDFTI